MVSNTDERYLVDLLVSSGAIRREGHYVYKSGRHGSVFIEKDRILANTSVTSKLCYRIAKRFFRDNVEVVAGPSMGGATMAQWVAYYLDPMPYAVYAEDERGSKVFRRVFADLIPGKRILVVDDVVDTGGSAARVIKTVERLEGKVVGVGALWNRGDVSFGNYPLYCLANTFYQTYSPAECPLCRDGIPLIDVGSLAR
ncbi:MAG: phosphoribosyltransferase family protein [Dehalococcoidales bacterium]|nr:phosphoribosyltransferase family protein [Dehalococcoidales bacterium]